MANKKNNNLIYLAGGALAIYFLTKKKTPAPTEPTKAPLNIDALKANLVPADSTADKVINWFTGLW
jgi:hypothetical protein